MAFIEINNVIGMTLNEVIENYPDTVIADWLTLDGHWYFHTDDMRRCYACDKPIIPGAEVDEIDNGVELRVYPIHVECCARWREHQADQRLAARERDLDAIPSRVR